jgi:hypothetical protein
VNGTFSAPASPELPLLVDDPHALKVTASTAPAVTIENRRMLVG